MADRQMANEIKEQMCYLPIDFKAELKHFEKTQEAKYYTTPDDQIITIKQQLIEAPQVHFWIFLNL